MFGLDHLSQETTQWAYLALLRESSTLLHCFKTKHVCFLLEMNIVLNVLSSLSGLIDKSSQILFFIRGSARCLTVLSENKQVERARTNDGLSVSNKVGVDSAKAKHWDDLRIRNIISGLFKTKLRAAADKWIIWFLVAVLKKKRRIFVSE